MTLDINIPDLMREYGSAIRGDWSDFDGRSEQRVWQSFAEWTEGKNLPDSLLRARSELGLCEAGGGHWCGSWGHCDDDCGCAAWHGKEGDQ